MSSPAPVAQQATLAQTAVAACSKPSFGGIISCLFLVLLCAGFGYGSGKNAATGQVSGTGKFLYFLACCYCLSTLSSIWNYMFPPPCPAPAATK